MDATQSGVTPEVEPDQARPYVVEMLDCLRRQREALNVNRSRYVLLARKYGLTFSEIAEYVGMSASGVRYIVEQDGPDESELPVFAGGGA